MTSFMEFTTNSSDLLQAKQGLGGVEGLGGLGGIPGQFSGLRLGVVDYKHAGRTLFAVHLLLNKGDPHEKQRSTLWVFGPGMLPITTKVQVFGFVVIVNGSTRPEIQNPYESSMPLRSRPEAPPENEISLWATPMKLPSPV